ncbi:MAG TPA: AAA domain-containing protein, partial [Cyclobacteriaceae bacterium]|nr:AAA domain-containing protein [Cyclobacteriaceae bacterium]
MSSQEQLQKTLDLIKLERQADLEQYRQKVLMRSLSQRTKEGVTWYPIRLLRDYIGTGERIMIEVERTNQLDQPHSFQSGKLISLFTNASGKPEKEHANGVVNYVRDNTMVITLNGDDLPDWIHDGSLGVDVMFDEMSYREMEYALREVMKADGNRVGELREFFLGESKNERLQKEISHEEKDIQVPLNDSQQNALNKILQSSDAGFIHGPPGTGKTTTLVEGIKLVVHEEGQVLVCAPSNAAVDLLAEKLGNRGLNVLRIGHPARVTEQALSKTLDARIALHENYHELKSLRKKMEKVRAMASKYKRSFGFQEREQRKMLKEEARALKADADLLEFYIINDLLNSSEVICSTLVGSSHPVLRKRKYKTVFIDEAGQALEPACWIPLLKVERVILAGDHCQLPPTIKSNEAATQGLARTLFEKGIERYPQHAALLQVQYRMHEDIMRFSSDYFYEGKLIADDSVKHELLRPNQPPVEFIDTAGCGYNETQDLETLSRLNKEEAELLIKLAERLVEDIGLELWLEQGLTMGIITPYRAQVDHLHHLAEASTILEPLHRL